MIITRERSIPLGYFNSHSSGETPSHIADSIAEDMHPGEYRIKYRMRPVIFVRLDNWDEDLRIINFDPKQSGTIVMSNDQELHLSKDALTYYFEDIEMCRVILIGNQGYSSFKIIL